MGWHCSRVSAPKRSAKIISAQIKLWPLPGRPGISALLICLSNETPAHREPSGSPPHTDVSAPIHTDANTQTQTPRHPHWHVHAPSCTLASHGEFVAVQFISVERERDRQKSPRGSPSSSEPPKLTPCHHHSYSQSLLPTPIWIIYT